MPTNETTPCPGPALDGCPAKNPAGPKGGRCESCNNERKRITANSWASRNRKRTEWHKAIDPAIIKADVALARRTEAKGIGFKGAVKVVEAMLRCECFQ